MNRTPPTDAMNERSPVFFADFRTSYTENLLQKLRRLMKRAGFETLETGALATARYLEPVAALNITLGYGLGHGTDIAPTWQRAA